MEPEQDKTLEALQMAIQMEIDGKEYYQRVSRSSDNQIGRELFQSLAAEEDIHRQKFAKIYDALRNKKAWPKISFQPERGKRLRTIFGKAIEAMGSNIKAPPTELDAIQTAMDMENKTYDFYKSQNKSAIYDAERDFYQALAAEERVHYLVLHDYREYLVDPASWFAEKEHPSLDGG
jgi:rubrerythrin